MVKIPVPSGRQYFPFQVEGIRFALGHPSTLLADEMGIGKTIQAIGLINAEPTLRKIIIICPASMRLVWRRELEKWLVRSFLVGVIGVDSFEPSYLFEQSDILIINYDRLHRFTKLLQSNCYDLAILDECHFVKNPAAKRTKAATNIKAHHKLALSGTPILNRPAELLPVLSWLDPERWPLSSWHDYGVRYCGAFWNGFAWDLSGASNLEELARALRSTLMIRRTKAEVLPELPAKMRTVIELSPTTEMRGLVERELEAFKAVIGHHSAECFKESAAKLNVDWDTIDWDNLSKVRHETALAKVGLVAEFVSECLEGGSTKIVIFAYHRDVVSNLRAALSKYSPVILFGGMSSQQRQAAIDTFQGDEDCRVFIGNIQAAGVGITLSPASSHVVFAELSWVPAEITQAEDRLHRIGQHDSVLVQHLVLEGSLDAMMAKVIVKKQRILDRVLEATQSTAPVCDPLR
jgi:SWI/SNF-related matrix-associated actin-dependent regulator of chromatin subfamily A-like protein 1